MENRQYVIASQINVAVYSHSVECIPAVCTWRDAQLNEKSL